MNGHRDKRVPGPFSLPLPHSEVPTPMGSRLNCPLRGWPQTPVQDGIGLPEPMSIVHRTGESALRYTITSPPPSQFLLNRVSSPRQHVPTCLSSVSCLVVWIFDRSYYTDRIVLSIVLDCSKIVFIFLKINNLNCKEASQDSTPVSPVNLA